MHDFYQLQSRGLTTQTGTFLEPGRATGRGQRCLRSSTGQPGQSYAFSLRPPGPLSFTQLQVVLGAL